MEIEADDIADFVNVRSEGEPEVLKPVLKLVSWRVLLSTGFWIVALERSFGVWLNPARLSLPKAQVAPRSCGCVEPASLANVCFLALREDAHCVPPATIRTQR